MSLSLIIDDYELNFIQGAYFNRLTNPESYEVEIFYKQSADSSTVRYMQHRRTLEPVEKIRAQLIEKGIAVSEWNVDASDEQETQWRKDNGIPWPRVFTEEERKIYDIQEEKARVLALQTQEKEETVIVRSTQFEDYTKMEFIWNDPEKEEKKMNADESYLSQD